MTSKAWFINTHLYFDRTVVHNIKTYGYPFVPTSIGSNLSRLFNWFLKLPTMMYTRSHISLKTLLKVRPVYNVPMLFLRIETMLTYPLHCIAMEGYSAILYGYETIRGGLYQMNQLAYHYTSYMMIDWSSFDQSVPYTVIMTFFTVYLPSLIVVNHYYAEIHKYPEATHHASYTTKAEAYHAKGLFTQYTINELTTLIFATKISNTLNFLWTWYQNMVIISPDGFAYVRRNAGVLSGFLNTQYLDSYANLFVMIYSMLTYGFSPLQIETMLFFILGDDNICFSNIDYLIMENFFLFLPGFAATQFGMTLSVKKSILTRLRNKIEVLGYRNSDGLPRRNVEKLIAQLAFPERHTNDLINMHRAIGYAWSSAGQCPRFHDLCRQVFLYYRNKTIEMRSTNPELYESLNYEKLSAIYSEINELESAEPTSRVKFTLPGPFQALLSLGEKIPDINHFPDLYTVIHEFESWKGFLGCSKKWDNSYFSNPPEFTSIDIVTLQDIRHHYGPNFELELC